MSLGGDEYVLRNDDETAVVTQVGAGLRVLRHGARDLVRPYPRGEVRPSYRGALLAPWPNRVVDGRYAYDGQPFQLEISEPERNHALHGLVSWARFDLLDSDGASVVLRHALVPRTGYPFCLEVVARYALDARGLTCTVRASNTGERWLPYGLGAHPYLLGGPGTVDGWTLDLPADEFLEITPDRKVPTALRRVEGTAFDFRKPRRIGTTAVDHAFTALRPDTDGRVRARVVGPDGSGVECTWDSAHLPWVQVHTADLPDPAGTRLGLALEPMSCPPDAFNSGTDLVHLGPGEQHVAEWTLRAMDGA